MLVNTQGKKYLLVSQHWSSKKGKKVGGDFVYVNPLTDEGKKTITHLKDLEALIEFHQWSDNGIYYKFVDNKESSWGMETYEILENGSLKFVGADYDTSD